MMPARVRRIIEEVADLHEVSPEDIIGRSSQRAVEIARLECYRLVLARPKPNGATPTQAEVARWFGRSGATISVAVREAG